MKLKSHPAKNHYGRGQEQFYNEELAEWMKTSIY